MLLGLKKCLSDLKLPNHVEWISIREVRKKTTILSARNGRYDSTLTADDHGFMVEVFVKGQFGYAATNRHSLSAIQDAANKAIMLATQASHYKLHSFSLNTRPKTIGHYRSPLKQKLDLNSLNEIMDILISGTNALKISDQIINTAANTTISNKEIWMVNSDGADMHQEILAISLGLIATGKKDQQTQTRTNGHQQVLQIGIELFNKEKICQDAHRIGEQAIELLHAENCPTGLFDIVLAPDQMDLQVHESIGHPLELDRIIGDERNYAGWSFIKPKDFGTLMYGSPLLNVTFDPTVPNELATYGFDDIGNPATREYLIKDGLLIRGLGSLESQERLNLPGVANMRSTSWNRPPIDRIGNVNIEPGETSLKEMISQIENGIYMETNRSWSIDDYRNKFQFGCEYARKIENGQLGKILKNPNYRGITTPFWNQLRAVGDLNSKRIQGSFFCGKGEPNQLIPVGHAVPACHFAKIETFGG